MRLRAEKTDSKSSTALLTVCGRCWSVLLRDNPQIRTIIPGVIRQVRDAKGAPVIRITVPTTNGWKAIALSAGARQELFISTAAAKTNSPP